jgi:hypothetical protein
MQGTAMHRTALHCNPPHFKAKQRNATQMQCDAPPSPIPHKRDRTVKHLKANQCTALQRKMPQRAKMQCNAMLCIAMQCTAMHFTK